MKVGIFLLSLAVSASGAPQDPNVRKDAPDAPKDLLIDTGCSAFGIVQVPLTSDGWSLECSDSDGNHWVHYSFHVPAGHFASVEVYADHLEDDDTVRVSDDSGVNIEFVATPTNNVVKSYVTFPGCGSAFLDTQNWNEGESYLFTPKSSGSVFAVATSLNASEYEKHLWNNVFIYEGGEFKGTLALLTHSSSIYSSNNQVVLYMAKKVAVPGAAVITDVSNIGGKRFVAQYVPQDTKSFVNKMSTTSYLTLVSSRAQSVNLTLETLSKSNENGELVYMKGGPVRDLSHSLEITKKLLPMTFTAYANTFYLYGGDAVVKFAVAP